MRDKISRLARARTPRVAFWVGAKMGLVFALGAGLFVLCTWLAVEMPRLSFDASHPEGYQTPGLPGVSLPIIAIATLAAGFLLGLALARHAHLWRPSVCTAVVSLVLAVITLVLTVLAVAAAWLLGYFFAFNELTVARGGIDNSVPFVLAGVALAITECVALALVGGFSLRLIVYMAR